MADCLLVSGRGVRGTSRSSVLGNFWSRALSKYAMDVSSLCILSPTLTGTAWLAWGLSRRGSAGAQSRRWWRVGGCVVGMLAIAAAGIAFLDLGLSSNLELAFADEHPSPEALRERLAHNDRLATLVLAAGLAAGLAVTLVVKDAARR